MSRKTAFKEEDAEREARMLLAAEPVDMNRLCDHAVRFGFPSSLRPQAWRLLLGPATGSDDVTDDPIREIDAAVVLQARSDLHHFYTYHSESVHPESRAKFEQLLFLFIRNHSEIIYHKRLIYFLHPFFVVFRAESEAYSYFTYFTIAFESYIMEKQISHLLANFMMLLRTFFPDLLSYIEDEELSPNEWALPWLRNMLCTDLTLDNILRLLDAYFSLGPDAFDLHLFTCLAILQVSTEEIFDMECSEMKGFLRHPPSLRLDQILAQAFSLQREVSQSKLLDRDPGLAQ